MIFLRMQNLESVFEGGLSSLDGVEKREWEGEKKIALAGIFSGGTTIGIEDKLKWGSSVSRR